MKRKHVLIMAVSIVLCLSFGTVQAATSISLVPNAASVTVGDQIVIDVVLNSDDLAIGSGALDFTFAPSTGLINYNNDFTLNGLDPSLSGLPTSSAGMLNDFGFASPTFDGFALNTNNLLATMSFDTVSTGTADFSVLLEEIFLGSAAWFDNGTFSVITDFGAFEFNGASVDVNAVPIPSTLLILGSGLVGLVGIGHRKRS